MSSSHVSFSCLLLVSLGLQADVVVMMLLLSQRKEQTMKMLLVLRQRQRRVSVAKEPLQRLHCMFSFCIKGIMLLAIFFENLFVGMSFDVQTKGGRTRWWWRWTIDVDISMNARFSFDLSSSLPSFTPNLLYDWRRKYRRDDVDVMSLVMPGKS